MLDLDREVTRGEGEGKEIGVGAGGKERAINWSTSITCKMYLI